MYPSLLWFRLCGSIQSALITLGLRGLQLWDSFTVHHASHWNHQGRERASFSLEKSDPDSNENPTFAFRDLSLLKQPTKTTLYCSYLRHQKTNRKHFNQHPRRDQRRHSSEPLDKREQLHHSEGDREIDESFRWEEKIEWIAKGGTWRDEWSELVDWEQDQSCHSQQQANVLSMRTTTNWTS